MISDSVKVTASIWQGWRWSPGFSKLVGFLFAKSFTNLTLFRQQVFVEHLLWAVPGKS